MPKPPPDLEHAPEKWKVAFRQLKAYAQATGLAKVIVKGATVTMKESPDGIIVEITVP